MSKRNALFTRILSLKIFLLLFSTLLFLTCSEDESITDSPVKSVLASATIGTEGGTLEAEDFELTIPSGAFLTHTELTLNILVNENSSADNVVSRVFQIEGLPESFSQPLTIKLKYSGEISDSSYIAIGENVWVSSLNDKILSYHFLPASESSGYITSQIAPTGNGNSSISKSNSDEVVSDGVNVYAVSSKDYLSDENNFKIYYTSSISKSYVENIASYLEKSYNTFKELGFKYDRRTVWPIEVHLESGLKTNDGKVAHGLYATGFFSFYNLINSYNTGYLRLNADYIADAEEMKSTIGHEFFHLVQGLYDSRGIYAKRSAPSKNYWINEASAVWAESFFSDDSNFTSEVFILNADYGLAGAKLENENPDGYGYGLASLIKFITNKYGNKYLVKIYDEIFAGSISFQAINNAIPSKVNLLWTEYLTELFTFELYEKPSRFVPAWLYATAQQGNAIFKIENGSDTVATFSKKLTDLSATIFSVKNTYSSLEANSDLSFELSGTSNNKILLFTQSRNESVLIKQGENSVILQDFKTMTDAGNNIIAVVTNNKFDAPYTDVQDIKLTIKVLTEDASKVPVITEIYDVAYDRVLNEKRLYTTRNNYFRIKGKNLSNTQKIFANGVAIEPWYGSETYDTLLTVKMLPEFKGHMNIKVETLFGVSNEFPYLSGIPIDYLNSSDSLRMEFYFTVKYFDSEQVLRSRNLRTEMGFIKSELNWKDNKVTVSLNKMNRSTGNSGSGSAVFTFSNLENGEIDNIEVDYTETGSYSYYIHYDEMNHYFGSEEIYLIANNPHLKHSLLQNYADMRYSTQPNVSGILYDSKDAPFNTIDLDVDSFYRRFAIKLFHFR